MFAKPVTPICASSFSDREHICFGISPFNSYFSESRIESLAEWGSQHFRSMHFFVPDGPTFYTLEALGYEPEKAAWKARRQCQYLHNKITKALTRVGFFSEEIAKMILNWEALEENPRFQSLTEQVSKDFDSDEIFRSECLNASSWVLEGRVPPGTEVSEAQKLHAVKYLLAEIPLFLDTAGIVGFSSSVFAYHQCIPFIEQLIAGKYAPKRNERQGFLVVHPATEVLPKLILDTIASDELRHKREPSH